MRISDWSSDVCSSDLPVDAPEALFEPRIFAGRRFPVGGEGELVEMDRQPHRVETPCRHRRDVGLGRVIVEPRAVEVRRPLLSNQFDEPGADAMLLSDLAELQHIAFLQHTSADRKSAPDDGLARLEERRWGKEGVRTLKLRGAPYI